MGKTVNKVLYTTALAMAMSLIGGQTALAASATISIDGGNGSLKLDDHGGHEQYNEFAWMLDHTATVSLAVYDANSGELDNVWSDDYMGEVDLTLEDTWANSQSGIAAYSAPVAGMPACIGDIAADDSGPAVPVSFVGGNTGLTVEQFVYGGASAPFAIYEYTVTNNTQVVQDIKVAHFGDFDVASTNPNEEQGYDAANSLVWEWESDSGGYGAGTSLLRRPVSNYFLEDCCTMTWGDYSDQVGFFTGDPNFNGDKFAGPGDLEVDIATNVGTLNPGESAKVVFVTVASAGATSGEALVGLQSAVAAANACYDQVSIPQQMEAIPVMNTWGMMTLLLLAGLIAAFYLSDRRREV